NNDAKALFVVEKYGGIKRLSKGLESTKEEVTSFLDITDRVLTDNNEEGLLTLAFHPKYKENGFLYVYYSAGEKTGKKNRWGQEEFKRRSVISRFSRDKKDSTRADPK